MKTPPFKPGVEWRAGLADNLRRARLRSGLSVQDLADECGCQAQVIHSVERGDLVPSLHLAARLASVLGTTLDEIVPAPDFPP